jgi:hypothetical protein
VLERLEYPSSVFGEGISLALIPERDYILEVKLGRRARSGGSLPVLLPSADPPSGHEPGVIDSSPTATQYLHRCTPGPPRLRDVSEETVNGTFV